MASRVGLLGRLARRIERVFEGGGEAVGVDRVRRPPPSRTLPPPPSSLPAPRPHSHLVVLQGLS